MPDESPDLKSPAGVTIGGQPVPLEQVERIEVRNFTGLPDMATFRLSDPEGEDTGAPPYRIGDKVEIKLGKDDDNEPKVIFQGEIVASEFEFTTSAALISFRAYDQTHRLQRNRVSEAYQDMTTSDIVKKVLQRLGITAGTIDSTSTVHKFMQQSMETDLDFLKRIAAMDNCEVGVADGKGYLAKQRNGGGTTPVFAWRENAISFKPRMTSAQQHDKVTVQSYDPKTKNAIKVSVSSPTSVAPAAQDARSAAKQFGSSELLIADRVVGTEAEARELAQSTLDSLAGGSFEAEGVMHGDPAVKAGGKIKIDGFKKPFDGEYVVTSVTHVYASGGYRTKFAISGRHPRTLTDVMRPQPQREWGTNGLVVGIVTNLDDSGAEGGKMGRVRVKFPALSDKVESAWARVVSFGAGKDRGMVFLPDVGDEVIVAFEHGDTRRPVVLGSLHNAKDTPGKLLGDSPPRPSTFAVNTPKDAEFKTGKKFVIEAKDHMQLTIEKGDEGPGDVELKAADGVKIDAKQKLDVKAGSTISFEGTGEIKLKSSAGITIEATGSLALKGTTVDINGTGGVTVKGAIINIG
jgi:uncharacterized protein involved in type VI secretion and phage assembly